MTTKISVVDSQPWPFMITKEVRKQVLWISEIWFHFYNGFLLEFTFIN